MEAMKLLGLVLAIIVAFDGSQSTSLAKNKKCQKLRDFAFSSLAKYKAVMPARQYARDVQYVHQLLGLDINNRTALDITICKIADATTLRELYEAVPKPPLFYEWFQVYYQNIQASVANYGGYTNADRIARIYFDLKKWTDQLKPGRTLREKTDLPTLTNFLNVMQVKYGSRWLSIFVDVKNQNFSIQDPEVFAENLFESDTRDQVAEFTGLTRKQASYLLFYLRDTNHDMMRQYIPLIPWMVTGVNLVGDLGYFNIPIDSEM